MVFLDINENLTIQMESSESSANYSDIYDKQSTLDYAEKMLLQINNQKHSKHFLSFVIIEGVIIGEDEQKIDMERAIQRIAASTLKVINRDVDIVGQLSSNQLLACIKTPDKMATRPICNQIIKLLNTRYRLRDVDIGAHFGFITVGANVGINALSLLSIAGVAVKRSKQAGPNVIVDYAELYKNKG